jgi:WD40 repeat protein
MVKVAQPIPLVRNFVHTDYVTALAWAPDGENVAAGSADGTLTILDKNARPLWSTKAHDAGLLSLAWNPDGRQCASGGQDGKIRLHGAKGEQLETLQAGGSWVEFLAYNSSGLLASAAGTALRIWNGTSSEVLQPLGSPCTGLGWNPMNPMIVSAACYGGVKHYKVNRAEPEYEYPLKGSILSLYWSPDGKYLACGCQDRTASIWNAKSGKGMVISGYQYKVKALSWNRNGRFLATSGSSVASVWDFGGRGLRGSTSTLLKGHEQPVVTLCFQNQGDILATADQSGEILLWDISKPEEPLARSSVKGEVACMAWSPDDSRLAVGDAEGNVSLFETEPHEVQVPATKPK